MPDRQNRGVSVSTRVSGPFFGKQLQGEEALSYETAERLCSLAAKFVSQRPWERVSDRDLVLLEDPQCKEICFCSIMGALGEVFSLHVYVGAESYRFYRKVSAGEPVTAGDFFASQRGVAVEFVRPSELTTADREVLRAFDYPTKRAGMAPMFRALRPGYHPWYVTEAEGKLLVHCLQAVTAFFRTMSEEDGAFWEQADVYPFLVPTGERNADYEIRMVNASEPPIPAPQPAEPDEELLAKVRGMNCLVGGAFELDHIFSSAMVGGKHERKACVRLGLAADGRSGLLFPPELGTPQDSTGEHPRASCFEGHTGRALSSAGNPCEKSRIPNTPERLGAETRGVCAGGQNYAGARRSENLSSRLHGRPRSHPGLASSGKEQGTCP